MSSVAFGRAEGVPKGDHRTRVLRSRAHAPLTGTILLAFPGSAVSLGNPRPEQVRRFMKISCAGRTILALTLDSETGISLHALLFGISLFRFARGGDSNPDIRLQADLTFRLGVADPANYCSIPRNPSKTIPTI